MSLNASFILFYAIFVSIFVGFQVQFGVDALNIDAESLNEITAVFPDTEGQNPITVFIELILNITALILFSFSVFLKLNFTMPELAILNAVFIVPYSIVLVWNLAEFVRGIG